MLIYIYELLLDELLSEELRLKEELNRQIQWRLDDERAAKQQSDDAMQRKMIQIVSELSSAKESSSTDSSDLQRKLEKVMIFLLFIHIIVFIIYIY